MATHESILNKALANILQEMLPTHVVKSETPIDRKIPDILITARGRLPVIIEAEHYPGRDVEAEAKRWLGVKLEGQIHPVDRVIALVYPETLKSVPVSNITAVMRSVNTKYWYCIFHGDRGQRTPPTGWSEDSAVDLANLISKIS